MIKFVGWPRLGHSFTPQGLTAMLVAMGETGGCQALPVPPEALPETLRALAAAGCRGVNLTTPHKTSARTLVDRLDAHASRTGAVNGIAFQASGWVGTHSDLPGMADVLHHDVGDLSGATVLVLGAGGAARACLLAALDAGAARVIVACRRPEAGEAAVDDLARRAGQALAASVMPLSDLPGARADLAIHATPVGVDPDDTPLCAPPGVPFAMDLIYQPAETRWLAAARSRGARTLNGWPLWVHQARHLVAALCGRPAPGLWRCDLSAAPPTSSPSPAG